MRASCRTAAPVRTRRKTASYPGEREMEDGRARKVSLASAGPAIKKIEEGEVS